jgi:putative endonuclease
MKHYVYILKCVDSTFYTGYTNDIDKRVEKHQTGKGAKYTRGRLPVYLVYFRMFDNKLDAMKYEYKIKQMTREQKIRIIFPLE